MSSRSVSLLHPYQHQHQLQALSSLTGLRGGNDSAQASFSVKMKPRHCIHQKIDLEALCSLTA